MSKKELYIGVMSGTSLDGVDIVLCAIDNFSCKLLFSMEYPFNKELKNDILNIIVGSTTLKEIGSLDAKLGMLFGSAINHFIDKNRINRDNIKAIGLHGQTLWHAPNAPYPFSMQLGDANIVASMTRIKTVADFRRMDIANGGQGAPFAPAFHQFLFASLGKNIAVVNIGGMANITILGDVLQGWDSGCGNVLLDMWIDKIKGVPFDKDGTFARSGHVVHDLLDKMLNDDYFKRLPPKSTGREYFNDSWLSTYLPIFNSIKDEDIQRTLLELTAKSISNDLTDRDIETLIVCGGGAKNHFLLERLSALTSCSVVSSDAKGVDSDFLEAMAFAWFARQRLHERYIKLSSVTGAQKESLLGGIYG